MTSGLLMNYPTPSSTPLLPPQPRPTLVAAHRSPGQIPPHGSRTTGDRHYGRREYVSSSFGVVLCIAPDEETGTTSDQSQTQRQGGYHPPLAPVNPF